MNKKNIHVLSGIRLSSADEIIQWSGGKICENFYEKVTDFLLESYRISK